MCDVLRDPIRRRRLMGRIAQVSAVVMIVVTWVLVVKAAAAQREAVTPTTELAVTMDRVRELSKRVEAVELLSVDARLRVLTEATETLRKNQDVDRANRDTDNRMIFGMFITVIAGLIVNMLMHASQMTRSRPDA